MSIVSNYDTFASYYVACTLADTSMYGATVKGNNAIKSIYYVDTVKGLAFPN
jgi:hypothetical protein